MEKENSHMSKRILNLTLEIIYLLTGEECIIVKKPSNDHMTHVSQSWSRKQSPMMKLLTFPNNDKKILEVTQKIIKLLEGEVPIRCQEVTVSFGIEEGNNLGHKDLYKDDIMENRPPLTSPERQHIRNNMGYIPLKYM
ncbi:gastrula zinc finger protein XlCGF66.1-like isoform X2 [Aquarana catesbeiana]|uniref:gastrula zinc finger protein XlCGF66.1-like isoform X2 n=1 Tax=Aquarana catesbeiana TaxID=8400 RepID=UPI003CC9933F